MRCDDRVHFPLYLIRKNYGIITRRKVNFNFASESLSSDVPKSTKIIEVSCRSQMSTQKPESESDTTTNVDQDKEI